MAIHKVDPQAKVDIDLERKSVTVQSDADDAAFMAVLEDAGYPPRHLPV